MAPVCRFSHGSQQLHYTNPPSSLSTLKTEIKKERLKLGLCASLLVPSSIDGWVSCNEVVPKQGPLQLNPIIPSLFLNSIYPGGGKFVPPWFLRVLGGCGFNFWWQPHILLRLTPDKRIYNFRIPRTTPTHGLKKWLFEGSVVRKGPPLWKWSKIDQLFIFLAKLWIFLEPTVLHPLPHSKWGIVKKNGVGGVHLHG